MKSWEFDFSEADFDRCKVALPVSGDPGSDAAAYAEIRLFVAKLERNFMDSGRALDENKEAKN